MTPKLLYVEWLDHVTLDGGGWIEVSKLKKAKTTTMATLGHLIREDSHSITLAGTLEKSTKDAVAGGDVTIVRSAITQIRSITLGEKE